MKAQRKALVFADKRFEAAYRQLHISTSQAEKRLYLFITRALNHLLQRSNSGHQVPAEKIPAIYKQSLSIKNLWVIEIPPEWKIYYSLGNNKLIVIDMTCDGTRRLLDNRSGHSVRAE